LNITYEFTARDTPQQNHLAELGFAHLANYSRALMARANVPLNIRYKVSTKAFKTATLLDGLTVIKIGNKEATRYKHWCGKNPEFSEHLRTWGEVGTIKIKTNDKKESEAVPLAQQAYRKGVGKLLHVTRWTRSDIMNYVRELSRFAGGALMAHMKAMYRCMAYCVATAKRGHRKTSN
jgi:hypothetical protein